jgi:uncharacterized protein YejL (UPF0352 family)
LIFHGTPASQLTLVTQSPALQTHRTACLKSQKNPVMLTLLVPGALAKNVQFSTTNQAVPAAQSKLMSSVVSVFSIARSPGSMSTVSQAGIRATFLCRDVAQISFADDAVHPSRANLLL